MAISKTDLKFYLTADTEGDTQDDPDQSLGGYVSGTEVSPRTTLSGAIDDDDMAVPLTAYANVRGAEFLQVGREIMAVSFVDGASASVSTRGHASTFRISAVSGEPVFGISLDDLFDNRLSVDRKQYRCIAVKNTSETESAHDVQFYFSCPSINKYCKIKMAVEVPTAEWYEGAAASGSKTSLTDSSIPSFYEDDAFAGSVITFTGSSANVGQTRIVSSYDHGTKTLVFDSSLPLSVAVSDTFTLSPPPSQRVISGTSRPAFGTPFATPLQEADGVTKAISLNVNGLRYGGESLNPGDVAYIWIERALEKNAPTFEDNRTIITMRYTK